MSIPAQGQPQNQPNKPFSFGAKPVLGSSFGAQITQKPNVNQQAPVDAPKFAPGIQEITKEQLEAYNQLYS